MNTEFKLLTKTHWIQISNGTTLKKVIHATISIEINSDIYALNEATALKDIFYFNFKYHR